MIPKKIIGFKIVPRKHSYNILVDHKKGKKIIKKEQNKKE